MICPQCKKDNSIRKLTRRGWVVTCQDCGHIIDPAGLQDSLDFFHAREMFYEIAGDEVLRCVHNFLNLGGWIMVELAFTDTEQKNRIVSALVCLRDEGFFEAIAMEAKPLKHTIKIKWKQFQENT